MNKEYFIELSTYNIWANNIMKGWLQQLTEEQWNQVIISSFDSIGATVLHVVSAEKVWLDRLEHVAQPGWLAMSFKGSKEELITIWQKASAGLKGFIEDMEESMLHEKLAFKRVNGEAYEMEHYQVLAHTFNHSTYHRGQLVTMLRQAGFTAITSTDLLAFARI